MDEYAALAQRVVLTMDDVRGCLVLSRDGMVLGAYPEEDEQAFKPAWLKFVHVGEARRGFGAAPPPEQRAWNGRSPGEAATSRQPTETPGSDREEPPTVEAPPDRLRPATFSDPEPVTPAGRPAAFATEGSAFSRLEAEQAASA